MARIQKSYGASPFLPHIVAPEEVQLFNDIRAKITRLPEGVHDLEFRFGDDADGDPAVWIVFFADDDLHPSEKKLGDIRRAFKEIREEVYRSGTHRYPFTRIETE